VYLCCVPRGKKRLPRPCDIHLFRRYTNYLRNLLAEGTGSATCACARHAIACKTSVPGSASGAAGKSLEAACDHNGHGQCQAEVSDGVGRQCHLVAVRTMTCSPCAVKHMLLVLPKGHTCNARIVPTWAEGAVTCAHSTSQASPPSPPGCMRSHPAVAASMKSMISDVIVDKQHPRNLPEAAENWLRRLQPRNRRAASSSTVPSPSPSPAEHALGPYPAPPCRSSMPQLRRLPSAPQTLPRREHAAPNAGLASPARPSVN